MVFVCWQTLRHIPEIGVGIVPIESGALNQAHDGGCTLAGPQGASEKPVFASDGYGPDRVFRPVVVDRQLPVTLEARERSPAFEAVIERSGRGRAVLYLPALQHHPLVKRVSQWLGHQQAGPSPHQTSQGAAL